VPLALLRASLNKPWHTGNETMADRAFAETHGLRTTHLKLVTILL
jgi:hypothetical protein